MHSSQADETTIPPYDPTLTALPCYVRGCPTPPDRGAIHIRFGPVESCAHHDPARHGYARPFTRRQAPGLAALMATPPASDRPDIGPQPPVRPVGPDEPTPPAPSFEAPRARVADFAF